MSLFEKKVITNRLHFIKSFNEKEWWYSGIQFQIPDEENPGKTKTAFIGISEIRSVFIDSTAIVYFDGKNAYPQKKNCKDKLLAGYYLKKNLKKTDGHSLVVDSKKLKFNYYEIDNDPVNKGYKLEFKTSGLKKYNGGDLEVDIVLKQKLPVFEKYDDYFENYYGLTNHFLKIESGKIVMNGKEYNLDGQENYMYQDHCYGDVPRHTKWHWAAVWNNDRLLDVLTNYGVYPQNYTQILLSEQKQNWVRLNQDVSFENSDRPNRFNNQWKITSTQLDLNMELMGTALEREAIPFSWWPFFIDIYHYQCFARVWGKVLVNGNWIETGDMFGVFEEHHGKW